MVTFLCFLRMVVLMMASFSISIACHNSQPGERFLASKGRKWVVLVEGTELIDIIKMTLVF